MCWDFINLNMDMKEGPSLMPCQKRLGISWNGISIQMQRAWVSVLYLICGPIWSWGKRELIATNSWYVLVFIVWIIFLFWTGREKKTGLMRWICNVSGGEKMERQEVKQEKVAWEDKWASETRKSRWASLYLIKQLDSVSTHIWSRYIASFPLWNYLLPSSTFPRCFVILLRGKHIW